MAKKIKEDITSAGSVFDLVKKFDDSAEIIADSAYSNIKDWISTGNYILNAAVSGSLFGGLPVGRVTMLAGEPQTGKSYLQCSVCREAQKKGYTPIILDTEGSIDAAFVSRIGVDPKNCIIKQCNTISETGEFIANLCKSLQEQEEKYGEHQKVILVLDSLGNLTSDKEKTDVLSGNQKRDMTKQQELKALFRVNMVPLAKLGVLFLCISHVYASIGAYVPTNIIGGGQAASYNASVTLELSVKKLDDKANDNAASEKVGSNTTMKNGVMVTAKPKKSRFTIPRKVSFQIPYFKKPNPYVGLEEYLTWENAGVCRGNVLEEKAFMKLTPSEQTKCHPFEFDGKQMWAQEKDTARGIVVKHLGRQVSFLEFFSDTVFTDEYLKYLDENVIKPLFELPDQSSFDDIKDIEESLGISGEDEATDEILNANPSLD